MAVIWQTRPGDPMTMNSLIAVLCGTPEQDQLGLAMCLDERWQPGCSAGGL